jgi:hypothetical protein
MCVFEQRCSLCQREEPTKKTFREVAADLRVEYIFQEYERSVTSLIVQYIIFTICLYFCISSNV